MKTKELFAEGIGISSPWFIESVELEGEGIKRDLHIYLGHTKGARFTYEGEDYPVYDHQMRKWHHLRFFQHECFIHAAVPRVKTKEGKVKLVEVPWAQSGSSFTLLF